MNPFSLVVKQVLRCYENAYEIDGKKGVTYPLDVAIEAFMSDDRKHSFTMAPESVEKYKLLNPQEFYKYYSAPSVKISGDLQKRRGQLRFVVYELEILGGSQAQTKKEEKKA